MASRFYRIQVSLFSDTALDRDAVINTWHMKHGDHPPLTTPQDTANDMVDQLEGFYQQIQTVFGAQLNGQCEAKVYDLAEAKPRTPVLERSFTIVPGSAVSLPTEVAVTLSMQAAIPSGVNPRRRKGRVFIGPWRSDQLDLSTNRVIVPAVWRTNITDAAKANFDTGLVETDPRLCVYSEADDDGGADLAGSFHEVVQMHVDDAFDTQRRRGTSPTVRTVVSIDR